MIRSCSGSAARFHRAFGPKAVGAWNLHAATVTHAVPLDFFLMLSSISSVLGITGQTNYASANYFLRGDINVARLRSLTSTSAVEHAVEDEKVVLAEGA